ncbi:ABC transporter permease [Gracilibacillus sp. S3-1-1]|uniref:ABC transporter permease n=1 Tax=Gracilibacillus pellucidus TaxID=3095368 RepID=A0ACC6M2Q7_9BACI|nr:ABC transporter permease [Gracilibacillus sp. S3-1-1]MDX8045235.1 ABC transporter permease [Gracilibacillus sp. S3-1-1]
MKDIIYTRFLLLKKQSFSLTCWILLPLLVTVGFVYIAETAQDDMNVPIGMVLEEDSSASHLLLEAIEDSSLVSVTSLSEREAIRKLEQHELDSVFIIRAGYEENIHNGNRKNVLTSYYSDRSFAYTPVREMIVSIIQQDTGRSKAADAVMNLERQLNGEQNWAIDEIIEKSRQIEQEEDLLQNEFRYDTDSEPIAPSNTLWNPWIIWAFATMLVTILLFDWVIKEQKTKVRVRFPFTKITYPAYMLMNVFIYLIGLLFIDLITALVFYFVYQVTINILSLVTFRMMICLFAFLFVSLIRHAYASYVAAIMWTLVLIVISGTFLPFSPNNQLLQWLNPLRHFLNGEPTTFWLGICVIGMIIWYVKEGKKYA